MLLINKILLCSLISVFIFSGLPALSTAGVDILYNVDHPCSIPGGETEDSSHADSHIDEFMADISSGYLNPFFNNHSYSFSGLFSEIKIVTGVWQPPEIV
jgi:hypothetical protein